MPITIPTLNASDTKRFWSKVAVGAPGDCWPYAGHPQRSGHMQFWLRDVMRLSHRVAWTITNGPIPAESNVLHRCDNPCCVNPDHLFLGSIADNNADRDAKGRGRLPLPEQVRRLTPGPIQHGTVYAYVKRQCHCAECRAAIRAYRHSRKSAS